MAELDIGEHCSATDCRQLDFLPLQCDLCHKIYCKLHAGYNAHSCAGFIQSGIDHSSTASHKAAASLWFQCEFGGCTGREMTEIRCRSCGATFCLAHRHQSDHLCPAILPQEEPLPKTKELVQAILNSRPAPTASAKKALTNPKSAATAAKIALIKMKQKAIGDASIVDADRIFFNVVHPLSSQHKQQPMFFNRTWYVGKVVDKVAAASNLVNTKKLSSSPTSLRMFDGVTGLLCPSGKTLADLVDSVAKDQPVVLLNGGTVIIEYVEDAVEKVSVELYQ